MVTFLQFYAEHFATAFDSKQSYLNGDTVYVVTGIMTLVFYFLSSPFSIFLVLRLECPRVSSSFYHSPVHNNFLHLRVEGHLIVVHYWQHTASISCCWYCNVRPSYLLHSTIQCIELLSKPSSSSRWYQELHLRKSCNLLTRFNRLDIILCNICV